MVRILSFFKRSQYPAITTNPPPNFTSSSDLTIVAYLPPKTTDNALLHEQFEDVAARYKDRYSFGLQIVGEAAEAGLGCWNNVDRTEYGIRDLGKVGAMDEFVKGCATPLVWELTSRSGILLTQVCEPLLLIHYKPFLTRHSLAFPFSFFLSSPCPLAPRFPFLHPIP